MKKDIFHLFIEIVSGMNNFKSSAGKIFRLVDCDEDGIESLVLSDVECLVGWNHYVLNRKNVIF